jgi:hypothetical protein
LGSVAFLGAYQSSPGIAQAFLFGIGILFWEGVLINLYPFNFLEMDGYNIVADLLAMPTLRQQALALAPRLHRRLLQPRTLTKAEWIQITYLLLCIVSVLIYLIAHLDFLGSLLPPGKPRPHRPVLKYHPSSKSSKFRTNNFAFSHPWHLGLITDFNRLQIGPMLNHFAASYD